MRGRSKVIVIDSKDNVATALEPLEPGTSLTAEIAGRIERIGIVSAVPAGHKVALRQIDAGEDVIKYGEPIGHAAKRIAPGEHVHTHNVASRGKKSLGAQ